MANEILQKFLDKQLLEQGEATQLGSGDSVLRVSGRGQKDHLHHQCHRKPERLCPKGDPLKGHFPNDQAATKPIWLALRRINENWKNLPVTWHSARAQLAIQFGERFTMTRNFGQALGIGRKPRSPERLLKRHSLIVWFAEINLSRQSCNAQRIFLNRFPQ